MTNIVIKALKASAKSAHEYGCARISYIRDHVNCHPIRAFRRREEARVAALRTAPPCTCHVRIAVEALESLGVKP